MTILKFLFEAELDFPRDWESEARFGRAAESARRLEQAAEELPGEEGALWREYRDLTARLRGLECRREFERGFVLGAKLLMEVAARAGSEEN